MTREQPVKVRVLPNRGIATDDRHYLAGAELELPPDEARVFVEAGFVEAVEKQRRGRRRAA